MYEGTTKNLYETEDSEYLIQEFKDSTSSYDNERRETIKGKSVINNEVSSYLFEYLEGFHVPTHFVKSLSNRDMIVRRIEMLPFIIIIRNTAAGSFCKRYGIEEGKELEYPISEYFLKNKDLQNPMINTSHVIAFGFATSEELRTIDRLASKINAVLKSFFDRRNLKLIDFQLEFGRYKNKILLGDELSIDTCRLWDAETHQKFDNEHNDNWEIVYEIIKQRIFQQPK